MYFLGMPRAVWPPAMDARPLVQPEESSIGISSESRGTDADRMESPPLVSEKARGKRAATDEPALKKRKMVGVVPRKPDDISLGGDQTTQTQSVVMSEWSDDDGAPVAPPLSTKVPPCSMRAEEQPKGGEGDPEQSVKGVLEQPAKGVPEQ